MADAHIALEQEPTEDELTMMQERMRAYIFPNHPVSADEIEAFNKAVDYQIAHEKTLAAEHGELGVLNALPNGVSSFEIGTFSMSFGNGGYKKSFSLDKSTICPYAYSVLLRAGLLYRGVQVRGASECL